MLTQVRGNPWLGLGKPNDLNRAAHRACPGIGRSFQSDDNVIRFQLGIVDDFNGVLDDAENDATFVEDFLPVRQRLAGKMRVEDLDRKSVV